MDPAARITPESRSNLGHPENDATVSAREHEAHTYKAVAWLDAYPPDEGTVATAQVHATLALAWATRLNAGTGVSP